MAESEQNKRLGGINHTVVLALATVAAVGLGIVAVWGGIATWRFIVARNQPAPPAEVYDSRPLYKSIARTEQDVSFDTSIETSERIAYYVSEAWIFQNAGKQQEALAQLREAETIAANGPYPHLYAALGAALTDTNPQEAQGYYQRALQALDTADVPDESTLRKQYNQQLERL